VNPAFLHPVVTCAEAAALEARVLAGDEGRAWRALQVAGVALAEAVALDLMEVGGWSVPPRLLVLAGKGHNAGDALIAAQRLRARVPGLIVEVRLPLGERALRPLAWRAWRELVESGSVRLLRSEAELSGAYDVALDGVFGFSWRPPLPEAVVPTLRAVNAHPAIRLRAAVDLPSGLDAADAFRADFTYATGSVKAPLLELPPERVGRWRYLDLGFFAGELLPAAARAVLTSGVLAPLRALRPTVCAKRTFGHVVLVGGTRMTPGAILMATQAALRGGAGLVTACVPESLAAALAAAAPEAMWLPWPETPEGGGLALEGMHLLRTVLPRATALVLGPGLGREAETRALAVEIARMSPVPLVIDADALRPEIVAAGAVARVLTPHAGEWARIGEAVPAQATVIRKGPRTWLQGAGVQGEWHAPGGGPVLARGGSGDVLAGLVGARLAQRPDEPARAAAEAVFWHGLAAERLARAQGHTAACMTQLLAELAPALRAAAGA
jgi:ADP-dependent NAD(P)H-hydrate dehydratase / NAD(P)H-hydrate epimerase